MADPGAVERNEQVHAEALRRAVARNQDSTLNWNSGAAHIAPGGPGDDLASPAAIAGVGGFSGMGNVSPEPNLPASSGPMTSAPSVDTGCSGLADILANHHLHFGDR